MKAFIISADGMHEKPFKELLQNENFEVYPKAKVSQEELRELLPKAQGLVIRSATTVGQDILDLAPNLKIVIRAGEGTDNIDKVLCKELGVKVANTPGADNNSAAEHALALMMSGLRKIPWAHASMREGLWEKSKFMGNELAGKTIGLVGMGRIGKILSQRLAGFEVSIRFYDPYISQAPFSYTQQVEKLEDVFKDSDIVSVHVPKTKETSQLINKDLLELMPSHSLFINAARGGIVNEQDLYEVLKEKKIRGAALDVFVEEPLSENSPLKELDNIILTPHLGASTQEAQRRVGEMSVHQLHQFFVEGELLNEVKVS